MENETRKSLDALERACEEVLDAETLKAVVAAKRRIEGEPERENVSRRSIKIPVELVPKCSVAKTYEALVEIRDICQRIGMDILPDNKRYRSKEVEAINSCFRKAVEALSTAPRNCDTFGGDYKMLHTAWFDWTGSPRGHNDDGTVKLTFGKWLLEIAEVRHA